MYKSMFRPEVISFLTDLVQNCHPCNIGSLGRQRSTTWLSLLKTKLCLYKPCAMCLSGLHFQPCAGSDPDCNCCCCLSNKYTCMQLRSPEVTRVNFHLSLKLRTKPSSNVLQSG